jgi:hexosaminidase
MNKFNKLHWHIVDSQSFPFDSSSEPELVKGAYTPKLIYSADDLTALNEYAHRRGVEIIFEVDVPGHAASWGAGKPELLADCIAQYGYNVNNLALNPVKEETYTTLKNILSDIVAATGTSVLHLGGDEVVYNCWKSDPTIVSFMAEKGWTNYNSLLNYFVTKADDMVKELTQMSSTSRTIHWEEVFSASCDVSDDTIFQVWTSSTMMSALTAAGYKVISSPQDYWYLDHSVNTWKVMYEYEPTVGLSPLQASNVIGGEVAMWGEFIYDGNFEQMVYPRAQAVAERLWSPESVNDTTTALDRMLI